MTLCNPLDRSLSGSSVHGILQARILEWVDIPTGGFPGGSAGIEYTCNVGDLGSILGWEDPLEKGRATHSSILAWRIPWTEEPDRLQSKEL